MSYNIKEIRVNSFPRLVLAWNNAVAKVIFLLIGWSTTVMPEFGERVTCDGFFGLFWFWCVCFEWRRVALRNESLIFKNKKKNQVKPVNPTFRLNFFILACPCLPEDWALSHWEVWTCRPIVWWTWFCLGQIEGVASLWILFPNQEFEIDVIPQQAGHTLFRIIVSSPCFSYTPANTPIPLHKLLEIIFLSYR